MANIFKLLVSNTLSNFAIAFWLSGPGIDVLTTGPDGSFGKNDCSVDEPEALAAATEL